jgi:hypothetical protein
LSSSRDQENQRPGARGASPDSGDAATTGAGSASPAQQPAESAASGPRPEEILATILKAKRDAFDAGRSLTRIVMPMSYYRALQEYHARLGEAPYDTFEYLSRYEIMGLPIFIENESDLRIE